MSTDTEQDEPPTYALDVPHEPSLGSVVTDRDGDAWQLRAHGWAVAAGPNRTNAAVDVPWTRLLSDYGPLTRLVPATALTEFTSALETSRADQDAELVLQRDRVTYLEHCLDAVAEATGSQVSPYDVLADRVRQAYRRITDLEDDRRPDIRQAYRRIRELMTLPLDVDPNAVVRAVTTMRDELADRRTTATREVSERNAVREAVVGLLEHARTAEHTLVLENLERVARERGWVS